MKEKMISSLLGWWRFFWRYILLFACLLLLGGWVADVAVGDSLKSSFLFLLLITYGFLMNILASVIVFFYIVNRRFRKSGWVLALNGERDGIYCKSWVCFLFLVRFLLLSAGIAFLFGAGAAFLGSLWGNGPEILLKHAKYLGDFALLPASYFSFAFLMLRRNGKCKLVIVREQA